MATSRASKTAGPSTTSRWSTTRKPVNFIMHLPSGDSVPATREPGGDRSFLPIDYLQKGAFLVQGDPTVYSSPPAL